MKRDLRKEEIIEAAKSCSTEMAGFIEGAEWADNYWIDAFKTKVKEVTKRSDEAREAMIKELVAALETIKPITAYFKDSGEHIIDTCRADLRAIFEALARYREFEEKE